MQVTLNFTGLACQSEFTVAAAAVDPVGNIAESLAITEASTPDVQWPALEAVLRATSHGSVWLDVELSETGSVSVVVCSHLRLRCVHSLYQY